MKDHVLAQRFGKALKQQRVIAGVSQLEMARLLRGDAANKTKSQSHVYKLESGLLDPRLSTIVRLADILGLTAGELLESLGD